METFTDKTITGEGAAVAFFYTKAGFANKYTGGYKETGKYGVITKVAKERTLVEINGKPAIEQYREWTGASAKDTEEVICWCVQSQTPWCKRSLR